jgi:WD40 repeat protein
MPIENITPIAGSIAFFGTIISILAGSFQVLDQLEKRRARWSNNQKLKNPELNQQLIQNPQSPIQNRIDWGEAVDVSVFYGRSEELSLLKQWIIQDECRLIALLGMGGIGKTSLSIKLAQYIVETGNFTFVIWRSLGNAPPIQEILADFIKFISLDQAIELPQEVGARISLLIEYLRTSRCLLILDNFESILNGGDKAGEYREGYEEYGELLRRVGSVSHSSCLLITSREKPKEVASLEGETLPARSLQLSGLKPQDGEEIFNERGLGGTEDERGKVIDSYKGNPLALKIISTTIKQLFNGSISEFLSQESIVFGGIRDLLEGQFNRLSDLEQEVIYWLAINREPVTISELREDVLSLVSQPKLIEALESLLRRSLIEIGGDAINPISTFTLQNAVMEYMTEQLIEKVSAEINQGKFKLFNSHALIKATTNDYIRSSQIRRILQEVIYRLTLEPKNIGEFLLENLRNESSFVPGYAVGNIINLLVHLKIDLNGYDFSNLTIKQAYLQGVNLQRVNFTNSEIDKSIFTQPFGSIQSVVFSPDGEVFAAGDANGQILLWQVIDGNQVLSIKGHLSSIWSVTFSPDSSILASSSSDQTIRLWDIGERRCLQTLKGHTNDVRSIVFSIDGKTLASSSSDQTIRLWDVTTGECLRIFHGHKNVVRAIAYSFDNKILASGSYDQTVRLWDVTTGKCLQILEGHTGWIRSVAFYPNTNIVASCSDDRTIRLWDVVTGESLKVLSGHINQVRAIAFSSDGKLLAGAGRDLSIKLWDVATGEYLNTLWGHTQSIESIAFSPNNQMLVSGSYDQTVRLWDVNDGKCLKTLQGYANWVWSVAFSPNGNILASGSDDFAVRLWDVNTGECLNTLIKHTSRVWTVTFSPDGKILASGSDDKTIKLWDVITGVCIRTLRLDTYRIKSICFSPDGTMLASTSADETVSLWDVSEGKCLKMQGHSGRVQSVAFSPDGKILVSGGDDCTVRLWDISTGVCIKVLQGHTADVNSVTFSPSGETIASGSNDRKIRLWDVGTGQCLKVLRGHTAAVQSVAFSPIPLRGNKLGKASGFAFWTQESCHTLVSCSADETVKLWDIITGECLKTLHEHLGTVWSVAVSPQGTTIASGSQDETIKLWDANSGQCLKTLRAKRPYEEMNITGVKGLTEATIATLQALGAVGD